jgi:hypothetical protein
MRGSHLGQDLDAECAGAGATKRLAVTIPIAMIRPAIAFPVLHG